MKYIIQRFTKGMDLYKSIQDLCKINNVTAGVVASGVGCVSKARIRDASGVNVQELNEPLEIVSLMGTVSKNRLHLHISLAKEDLSVVGGHLVEGCVINTTCELCIIQFDDVEFDKVLDESTGYYELGIKKLQ